MEYLLIQGNAEELHKSLEVFLNDGWKLYGNPFPTGKNVMIKETSQEQIKKGVKGVWFTEFAQAITYEQ